MHQSRMFSHPVEVDACDQLLGMKRTRAVAAPRAIAGSASGSIFTNHCIEQQRLDHGLAALAVADRVACTAPLLERDRAPSPSARRSRLRASKRSRPATAPARVDHRRARPMTVMLGRSWRWPISKSFGSWAGVTLTAPVPNSGSTCASATTGIVPARRAARSPSLPTSVAVALVVGVDGHRGVAEHRLGARGRDRRRVPSRRRAGSGCTRAAVDVLVLDLEVGERRPAARAPVDDPLAR